MRSLRCRKPRMVIDRNATLEPGIYHVTQRAPGRELMFVEDEDYLLFLKLLKKTVQQIPLEIYAFALMPNHVHLLLRASAQDMAAAMKKLFQSYAQTYNKKYARKGHVVCGTYRASSCSDPGYLLNISLYIHLNPLKARLTDNLYLYRWTSVACYLNRNIESFVNPRPVLALFENTRDSCNAYRALLNDIKDVKCRPLVTDGKAMNRFHRELLKKFEILRESYKFSRPVIKLIEDNLVIEGIRKRKGKNRFRDKKALLYCLEQMQRQGYTIQEMAEQLDTDRMSIYRALRSVGGGEQGKEQSAQDTPATSHVLQNR